MANEQDDKQARARHGRWLRIYHGAATIFWIVMVPVSIVTGLWKLIEYVTFLSLWALVVSEWAAWQASRAETAQDESNDRAHRRRESNPRPPG